MTLHMAHPELPGQIVSTSRDAFEGVWKSRGWVEVDEVVIEVDYHEMTVDELKEALRMQGLSTTGAKGALIERLEEASGE